MTRKVCFIRPSTPIAEAARLMRELDIGALPVCGDKDELVGIVTDRDITLRAVASSRDPQNCTAGEVLSPGIISVRETQKISEASALMEKYQIRRLPVLDATKRLVGIVSLADIAARASRPKSGEVLEEISLPAESHIEDPANR